MPTTRSLREGGCRKKHKSLEPQRHEDHRGKAFFSSPWRFLSWQRNPFPFTFVVQGYYAFCNNKDQVLNVRSREPEYLLYHQHFMVSQAD